MVGGRGEGYMDIRFPVAAAQCRCAAHLQASFFFKKKDAYLNGLKLNSIPKVPGSTKKKTLQNVCNQKIGGVSNYLVFQITVASLLLSLNTSLVTGRILLQTRGLIVHLMGGESCTPPLLLNLWPQRQNKTRKKRKGKNV